MKRPTTSERLANIEAFIASWQEREQTRALQATQEAVERRIAELKAIIGHKDDTIRAKDATIEEYRRQIDRLNQPPR